MSIVHVDGLALEGIVRDVYQCEYAGLCGMVFADNFEHRPIEAAILCLAKFGRTLAHNSDEYNAVANFLSNWRTIFEHPDENPQYTGELFVEELQKIVAMLRGEEQ